MFIPSVRSFLEEITISLLILTASTVTSSCWARFLFLFLFSFFLFFAHSTRHSLFFQQSDSRGGRFEEDLVLFSHPSFYKIVLSHQKQSSLLFKRKKERKRKKKKEKGKERKRRRKRRKAGGEREGKRKENLNFLFNQRLLFPRLWMNWDSPPFWRISLFLAFPCFFSLLFAFPRISSLLFAPLCFSSLLFAFPRFSPVLFAFPRFSSFPFAFPCFSSLLFAFPRFSSLLFAPLRFFSLLFAFPRFSSVKTREKEEIFDSGFKTLQSSISETANNSFHHGPNALGRTHENHFTLYSFK